MAWWSRLPNREPLAAERGEDEEVEFPDAVSLKHIWLTLLALLAGLFGLAMLWHVSPMRGANVEPTPSDDAEWHLRAARDLDGHDPLKPRIIYEHTNLCSDMAADAPLLFVSTRARSHELRQFMRRYLRPYVLTEFNIVFVAGALSPAGASEGREAAEVANQKLSDEAEQYKDLLIADFPDSDFGMANAGPMIGLQFAARCVTPVSTNQPYVSTTEDILLNPGELARLSSHLTLSNYNDLINSVDFPDLVDISAQVMSRRDGIISVWDFDPDKLWRLKPKIDFFITSLAKIPVVLSDVRNAIKLVVSEENKTDPKQRAREVVCSRSFSRCFRELLGFAAFDNRSQLLSTERIIDTESERKMALDSRAETVDIQCSEDWIASIMRPHSDLLEHYGLLYKHCKQLFEVNLFDVSNGDRIAGTAEKGPAVPTYQYDKKYCRHLDQVAVGVLTRADGFEQRQNFRQYWNETYSSERKKGSVAPPNSRFVFPVGRKGGLSGVKLLSQLQNEQEQYGDLIIGNFYDTYFTLPSKTMMFMAWAAECMSSHNERLSWVFKIDDDALPNLRLFDHYLPWLWTHGLSLNKVWKKHSGWENPITWRWPITRDQVEPDKNPDSAKHFINNQNELQKKRRAQIADSPDPTPVPMDESENDYRLMPDTYPYWMGNVFFEYTMGTINEGSHKNHEDLNIDAFPAYMSGPSYCWSKAGVLRLAKHRSLPHLDNVYIRNEDAMIGIVVKDMNMRANETIKLKDDTSVPARELYRWDPDIPLWPMPLEGIFPLGVDNTSPVCSGPRSTSRKKPKPKSYSQCECTRVWSLPFAVKEQGDARSFFLDCDWTKFDFTSIDDAKIPVELISAPVRSSRWPAHLTNVKSNRAVTVIPPKWIDEFSSAKSLIHE